MGRIRSRFSQDGWEELGPGSSQDGKSYAQVQVRMGRVRPRFKSGWEELGPGSSQDGKSYAQVQSGWEELGPGSVRMGRVRPRFSQDGKS